MTCSGCYQSFSGPWCDNCDQWPCKCPDAGYLLVSEADLATALRATDFEGISPYAAEPILMERAAATIFAALGAAQEKREAG